MITLHHLENSRSQRVLWLLEELGVPYEVKRYQRNRKTMLAPPELLQVHPLGKSPVITDNSIVVAESGAIIEYLLDAYGEGRLRPSDAAERRAFTFWLHFAEGSAMSPLLMKLVFDKIREATPLLARPVVGVIADQVGARVFLPNIKRHLDFMESSLQQQPWFAGAAFSAADIQMSFVAEVSVARGGLGASRPKTLEWLSRIQSRPAYVKALTVGGPYRMDG